MLKLLNRNLKLLYTRFRWPTRRRSRPKLIIKRFGPNKPSPDASSAAVHPSAAAAAKKHVRIATFNAALFSMAPAVSDVPHHNPGAPPRTLRRPKSILKRSSGSAARPEMRVSINLPEDEIGRFLRDPPAAESAAARGGGEGSRTVAEVLREVDADIVALQDVKAEEEKDMRPLSDLAAALGMSFVFAESWAPEYGNAVLSKWPIKSSTVHKIFDHTDFRNVLNVTIEVPKVGEVNFKCTHLDHLDENWRMKQVNAIIQSDDKPHILVGGLNSLEESDYSQERWTDIVKYYEDMGKPTPKLEVMRHLKSKQYTDAKNFAGECESVVMIAKGQSVQGTCKYGTRVDYILASPNSAFEFVPGSYSVYSSKGTSDHHIVKVDISKVDNVSQENATRKRKQTKPKVLKMSGSSPVPKGIWKTTI